MQRLPGQRILAPLLLALLLPVAARAEVEASVDLRLAHTDGRDSFLDGGLGKLRYDDGDGLLQLGRARLAWRDAVAGDWHAAIDLSAWGLDDHNPVDVTEAYLEWRPVPTSPWRSNLKLGAFYAPVSLEHRAPGWTNPYTISSSALNTWVGEELRTIGAAYSLEHLGIAAGGRFDYGAQLAAYGWNDPAGVIIALRGFALHDRQTPLFGRIGTFAYGGREQRVIFSEIDDRPGVHGSAWLRSDVGLELHALRYDNRGDPTAEKPSIDDYAWDTRFNSLGLRYDGPHRTAVIAQWLDGVTRVTADPANTWHFDAWFLLLAQDLGAHRFAARYDDFATRQATQYSPAPWSREGGNAFTLAWTWKFNGHLEMVTEWLRVDSSYNVRPMLGEAPGAVEHSLQLALRLSL
ncbi:MAG: hypothetical protein M3Y79_12365 [Pseudomonadota bacterium]|nr:hypothetical protein [Pseudomonadota bacterium]